MNRGTITPGTLALCIPAYNAANFLPRLLHAAQGQTVPFDEILVFDDASNDDTTLVAQSLGATVVTSTVNVGCSAGKNVLARMARSEWVHFHDADDSLDSDFVAAAKFLMANQEADVVLFGFRVIDEPSLSQLGTRTFDRKQLESDALAYALSEQINPFCGLYRKEAFLRSGGWIEDRSLMQCEDQAGHASMALAGLKFSADERILVTNFANPGSMTNSNLAGAQRALVRYFSRFTSMVPASYLPIIATRLWRIAGTSAAMNDFANARDAVEQAARIGMPYAPEGARWFRMATRISRIGAIRIRELLIRLFRPSARLAYRPQPGSAR